MLDTDGFSERYQATHQARPTDTNSNETSLEMDGSGVVDVDDDGTKVPTGPSVDDESREDDDDDEDGEKKEEEEEKDGAHEDEHEEDDPGSSEHESTFHSHAPLSLFPCCVFPSHVLPGK